MTNVNTFNICWPRAEVKEQCVMTKQVLYLPSRKNKPLRAFLVNHMKARKNNGTVKLNFLKYI